ncbi:hypothetical protein SNEBB_000424 [Seison nebaliae]|nr:hypothetical protein SNEBB_000424 [Seison nebaliae]
MFNGNHKSNEIDQIIPQSLKSSFKKQGSSKDMNNILDMGNHTKSDSPESISSSAPESISSFTSSNIKDIFEPRRVPNTLNHMTTSTQQKHVDKLSGTINDPLTTSPLRIEHKNTSDSNLKDWTGSNQTPHSSSSPYDQNIQDMIIEELTNHLESIEADSLTGDSNSELEQNNNMMTKTTNNHTARNIPISQRERNQRKFDKSEKRCSQSPVKCGEMAYENLTGAVEGDTQINLCNIRNSVNKIINNRIIRQTPNNICVVNNNINKINTLKRQSIDEENIRTITKKASTIWKKSILESEFEQFGRKTLKIQWSHTLIESITLLDMNEELRKHVNENITLYHQIIFIIRNFLQSLPNNKRTNYNFEKVRSQPTALTQTINHMTTLLGQFGEETIMLDLQPKLDSMDIQILAFIIIHTFMYDNKNDNTFRERIWPDHIRKTENYKSIEVNKYLRSILNIPTSEQQIQDDTQSHFQSNMELFKIVRAHIILKKQSDTILKQIEKAAIPMNLWKKDDYMNKQLMENFNNNNTTNKVKNMQMSGAIKKNESMGQNNTNINKKRKFTPTPYDKYVTIGDENNNKRVRNNEYNNMSYQGNYSNPRKRQQGGKTQPNRTPKQVKINLQPSELHSNSNASRTPKNVRNSHNMRMINTHSDYNNNIVGRMDETQFHTPVSNRSRRNNQVSLRASTPDNNIRRLSSTSNRSRNYRNQPPNHNRYSSNNNNTRIRGYNVKGRSSHQTNRSKDPSRTF